MKFCEVDSVTFEMNLSYSDPANKMLGNFQCSAGYDSQLHGQTLKSKIRNYS